MVTPLRHKSFQQNMFFSIGTIYILFFFFFSLYHFRREKEYRIDILHSRLQAYNHELSHIIHNGRIDAARVKAFMTQKPIESIRFTVIDHSGKVLYDSQEGNIRHLSNHLDRQEIKEAWRNGSGYDIKRISTTTNETYFYSATRIKNIIIRSAVPYSTQLTQSLHVDYSYILYAVILSILLFVVLYRNTSRVSRHIGYLRDFACMAEHGEELDHELERRLPDDELGEISHTITSLYWKLRHSEEDKERLKRQLTQNAAHELKTPAASIHGYLETLMENPDMPGEKRRHFLERCYAQSERMTHLLTDMAVLTKLDEMDAFRHNDRSGMTQKGVDIKKLMTDVVDDTALMLSERGITPKVMMPDDIVVRGDASLLYSVFRNLVDNTIAYAAGATEINVTAEKTSSPIIPAMGYQKKNVDKDGNSDSGENYFLFTFSDNGCGVEVQHLCRLFERFYRVDKGRSRKLGGTGLGLAIVKNAIIAHGGSCAAETTPGGGLTIRFTLKA